MVLFGGYFWSNIYYSVQKDTKLKTCENRSYFASEVTTLLRDRNVCIIIIIIIIPV